jgi:hypothetical protein
MLYLFHQQDLSGGGRHCQWARVFERHYLDYDYILHWTDLAEGHIKTLILEHTTASAHRVEAAVKIFERVQGRMRRDGLDSVNHFLK